MEGQTYAELAQIAANAYAGPYSGLVAADLDYDLLPRADELVVVMPGTRLANPLDVIRDLRAFPILFPKIGLCHAGFGSGGLAVWNRIKSILPTDKRIVYVGHSLAGAEAQVLAACHMAEGRAPCRVVTFGAPRVPFLFNTVFRGLLRSAVEAVEFQRAGDPVPDVPTLPLFYHPGVRRMIGKALPDPISNHSIELYVGDLKALGI